MRAIRAQLPGGPIDDAASWFLWLFAEDKFYPLLSFLSDPTMGRRPERHISERRPFLHSDRAGQNVSIPW